MNDVDPIYKNGEECHHQIVILVKVINDTAPCPKQWLGSLVLNILLTGTHW